MNLFGRTKRTKLLCICLLLHSAPLGEAWAQEKFEYAKQAELDREGNVYVSSDEGKLIKMAEAGHCSEVHVALDRQTVGCRVMKSGNVQVSAAEAQLEIYTKGGHKVVIQPGVLFDWHFWNDGRQVSLCSMSANGLDTCTLYDSATGRIVEQFAALSDEYVLPQWAKSQQQIQDESVPMSPELTQQRIMWISKVLSQIDKIRPGMRRKDLLKMFTTEGGISNRFQRTYVLSECGYIKVDVRFKAIGSEQDTDEGNPDDIIVSISRPYLQWSITD
jgi:hypothetical protein